MPFLQDSVAKAKNVALKERPVQATVQALRKMLSQAPL